MACHENNQSMRSGVKGAWVQPVKQPVMYTSIEESKIYHLAQVKP